MLRARPARLGLAVVAAVGTFAGGVIVPAAVATAAPSAPTGGARESVIVVLKDQLAAQPATASHMSARKSQAHSAQAGVLKRLGGAKPTNVINYTVGNAFAATVTSGQAAILAADPSVASVVPNQKISVAPAPASSTSAAPATPKASPQAATGPATVDPSACSTDPNKPLLEPEALQTVNAASSNPAAKTAASLGITGAGVKVAFIADGINPQNKGFIRTNGKSSIVDYKDFYGDGPNAPTSGAEAFGDASAISAQGNVVYDVADFVNPAVVKFPGGHCYIKIVGVAPGADVVALKAGSELLPNSAILQSIDYAVSVAHVNVINESFGGDITPDSGSRNAIELFNDQAVKAGVTVTASTGDAGTSSTIGNPATDPNIISAGASTDSRLYEQTGYALAPVFGNGKWQDSNISSLSSAGITQDGGTIDVSAPGEADWAVCDSGPNFGCASYNPAKPTADIEAFGGTSQASPITAGVAALVIQAYRKTHGGTSPAPAVVKKIITSTSRDLGLPGDEQGSGLIDARAAVEAALTWPGAKTAAPAGTGNNVALSANQLTLDGKPGTTQTGKVTVTNVGTTTQSIVASTRKYASLGSTTKTVALDTTSPDTTIWAQTGAPWVYKKVTFSVPSGADELLSTINWQSGVDPGTNGAGPVVRLSLFAPDGTYAGNTRPQGGSVPANHGLVTIKHPAAGTWTGVLYTPVTGGFTGNVTFNNEATRAVPVGTVTPGTKSLAPGKSTTISVKVPVPSVGGDTVYTTSIGSSGGHQTAVPLIVRSLVPTSSGSGTFAGTIIGGNARGARTQQFSYAFDVPAGKQDVDVSVKLADDPTELLEGVLVDPNGEVQSINSNQVTGNSLSMVNIAANPIKGRWRYVVEVQNPVSGKELKEPFTGLVTFNKVKVSALTLPAKLKAGTATTTSVTVTNNTDAPMVVQTDARTGGKTEQQLAPQFAGSTLQLPQNVEDLSQLPAYLVPPDTSKITNTASTTVPAQIELQSPAGGIDVTGDLKSAQNGSTVSTASVSETRGDVGLGYWFPYVQEIGPYGDGGAPAATSVLSATAVTKRFDSTVQTSTGDPFLATIDPTADPGSPLVIDPGKKAKITIQITPAGAAGKTHSGVLHLVTTPLGFPTFNTTGEVLATLPYSYTTK